MFPIFALVVAVGFLPGTSDAERCIPWSVLATTEGFNTQIEKHLASPGDPVDQDPNSEENGPTPPNSNTSETRDISLAFDLEQLCRNSMSGDQQPIEQTWKQLGPLRLNSPAGVSLLMRIAETDTALDHVVRLPNVGGWRVIAHQFASASFDRLSPNPESPGPELVNLIAAAKRWPELAAKWLSLQHPRDHDTPRYQGVLEVVGETESPTDSGEASTETPVVPLLLPRYGRGAQTGHAIMQFLRMYGERKNWQLVLSYMDEAKVTPDALATLKTKGASLVGIVGPMVRKDISHWPTPDGNRPPIWFQLRKPEKDLMPNESLRIDSDLSAQIRAHGTALEGNLPEPILVIGPPGKRLERWRVALDKTLEMDQNPQSLGAMVLTYDPRETDLTTFSEFVRQAKPATIVLAVPHRDIDRVLRYLARAGIWAKREKKKIRDGELHPFIIGPSSFGMDPGLMKRNRNYLDGVRIVSDIPMITEWEKIPVVQSYIKETGAYPPITALRIAAVLDRLQARLRTQQSYDATTALDWIAGETGLGTLELKDRTLTFPLRVYIFSANKFSPVKTRP